MEDIKLYALVILALVIGILVVKKVTSCLFRIIVTVLFLAILAAIYYMYFM